MAGQSKYVESTAHLKRYGSERTLLLRESGARLASGVKSYEGWLNLVRTEFPRIVPFLVSKCGVDFRGRILEIGAGGAWLTAELSKLPKVVEITAIDVSSRMLKEQAPRIFAMLDANTAKITRTPGDCQQLDFPDNHFDFVVCASVLHYAENIVQTLREAKRVLKPGGQFVAVREPVWPLVTARSRSKTMARLLETGYNDRFYTLADYKESFRQAGLEVAVKRVNISTGFKYYVNQVVNGLTHARYAFIATKTRPKPAPATSRPPAKSAAPSRPGSPRRRPRPN